MALYLGNPGASVLLPSPARGMDPTAVLATATAATIGGGRVVSRVPGPGRRTYKLAWAHLSPEQFTVLEEFYTGGRGPGPHALLDTTRRNHLGANQSAATSLDNTPGGFSVDGGEAVTSNPDTYWRGPRSLRWTLPATVRCGALEVDPPAGLAGVPAPAGTTWTFTAMASCAGLAGTVTVTPALSWRRTDASEIAEALGTPVALTVGAWSALAVTATVPAGAVAVRARLRVPTGALVSAAAGQATALVLPARPARPAGRLVAGGGDRTLVAKGAIRRRGDSVILARAPVTTTDVLVDALQLDTSATARAWVLGTGVPRVAVTELAEAVHTAPGRQCAATFVEVG